MCAYIYMGRTASKEHKGIIAKDSLKLIIFNWLGLIT